MWLQPVLPVQPPRACCTDSMPGNTTFLSLPSYFSWCLCNNNTVDTGTVVGHHLGAFSLFFL